MCWSPTVLCYFTSLAVVANTSFACAYIPHCQFPVVQMFKSHISSVNPNLPCSWTSNLLRFHRSIKQFHPRWLGGPNHSRSFHSNPSPCENDFAERRRLWHPFQRDRPFHGRRLGRSGAGGMAVRGAAGPSTPGGAGQKGSGGQWNAKEIGGGWNQTLRISVFDWKQYVTVGMTNMWISLATTEMKLKS